MNYHRQSISRSETHEGYTPRNVYRQRDERERVRRVPAAFEQLTPSQYEEKSGLIRIAASYVIGKIRGDQPREVTLLVAPNFQQPNSDVSRTIAEMVLDHSITVETVLPEIPDFND